jgi:hypothetical protein
MNPVTINIVVVCVLMVVVFAYGYWCGRDTKPKRKWCVMDPDDPGNNQTIVEARTPDEALGIAAKEVFGLVVEEAQ